MVPIYFVNQLLAGKKVHLVVTENMSVSLWRKVCIEFSNVSSAQR